MSTRSPDDDDAWIGIAFITTASAMALVVVVLMQ